MNRYFSLFNDQLTNGVTHKNDDQKERNAAIPAWKETEVPVANGGKPGPVAQTGKLDAVFDAPAVKTAVMTDPAPVADATDMAALEQGGRGSLIVQVSLADRAVPVPGVKVTVRPAGKETIISVMETDNSGKTQELELPAPPKSLSQTPGSKVPPYSLYDVTIEFPGYNTTLDRNVPVFDGIRSIQPASLTPVEKAKGGNREEIVEEAEPEDL